LWRCFLCRDHEMNITCGLVRAGGAPDGYSVPQGCYTIRA